MPISRQLFLGLYAETADLNSSKYYSFASISPISVGCIPILIDLIVSIPNFDASSLVLLYLFNEFFILLTRVSTARFFLETFSTDSQYSSSVFYEMVPKVI